MCFYKSELYSTFILVNQRKISWRIKWRSEVQYFSDQKINVGLFVYIPSLLSIYRCKITQNYWKQAPSTEWGVMYQTGESDNKSDAWEAKMNLE